MSRKNPLASITVIGTVHAIRPPREVGRTQVSTVVVEVEKEKGADRYDCDVWGDAPEVREGDAVVAMGALEMRSWKGNDSDEWRTTPTIRSADVRRAWPGDQLGARVERDDRGKSSRGRGSLDKFNVDADDGVPF